jgi:hypothetical protein
MTGCCQKRKRQYQGHGCHQSDPDPYSGPLRARLRRCVRPVEGDIKDHGNWDRRSPEDVKPRRGADPGAQQAVRGKRAGKVKACGMSINAVKT